MAMSTPIFAEGAQQAGGVRLPTVQNANFVRTGPGAGAKWSFAFLWLFTMTVFVRPEDLFKTPLHFELIFGSAAIVAYVCALAARRANLLWSRELSFVLILTAWFTIGIVFGYWKRGSYDVLTQVWLKTATVFFLLTQILTGLGRIRKILWAIILSELIVTTLSIVSRADQALYVGARLAGISENLLGRNYLGIAVAMTLPYIAAQYIARPSLVRSGLLLATVCSSMWMLVLTASRGGFLGVVFSITLTWWFILRRSRRGQIVGLLLATCLLVAAIQAPTVFWSRLQTVWSSSDHDANETAASANESAEGRRLLLLKSIDYTFARPILGLGLGNFKIAMGNDSPDHLGWFATHDAFTQVSSEGGIPALSLFLLLLYSVISRMYKVGQGLDKNPSHQEMRLVAHATLVSVLSFCFEGFFASIAYDYFLYYPAGIAVGLWAIYLRPQPSEASAESGKLLSEPSFSRCSSG